MATMATEAKPARGPVVACCAPVGSSAFDEADAVELARSFAALADPIRLRLFNLIAAAGDEVCNCDLIEPVGRSQPTVSHHLKILVNAGVLSRERRGTWSWYRIDNAAIDTLAAVLAPGGPLRDTSACCD